MERHLRRSWLDEMLASAGDLSALGLSMYFELFRSPAIDGGRPWHYFRAFAALKKVCLSSGQLSRVLHSKRQVFPLPSFVFPILSNVDEFFDFESFVKGAQCRATLARACWCELVVLFANHLACGNATRACSRPTAVQRDLMSSIRAAVDRILMDDSHVLWGVSEIKEDFQKRTVSYSGEICKAEALSLARIKPGLPPEGHGGSIEAVKWVGGRTRELLLNPLGCLCPDVGQDLPRLQGKVHIVREEALTVAMELVRRGICRWTHSSEVVTYRGQKVLNGLFGVPKSKLLESGESVLRVIMNLVPINSVLRVIPGRVAKLPNITQWLNVVLEEGETVRLAQSDMTCAFYLFGMPIEWSRLLCFNLSFDSSTLGVEARSNSEDKWYLSCAVLPMGWSSAVGVMQEIAESVLLQGGVDDQGQIHKTCPLPSWMINSTSEGMRQGRPWWHVYLDNFAGGAKVVEGQPKELIELQRTAEALWGEAGIVVSTDKSVVAAESGVELGAFIGGSGQWIGASCERMIKIIKSTLWLIHQPSISKKKLQIMMGRWCFALQFRRPGMCQFDAVWAYISSKHPRARQIEEVRQELLFAVLGTPLFHTWLGSRIDEVITCSDASQKGGAIAISRSLSMEGEGFLESQNQKNHPLAIPVLVISLFNGIGGAARCYDVAGVKVKAYLACDIHKPANRTMARRWPDTIFWDDVKTLTLDKLRELLEHVEDFEEVHLWAGFPCVDLSSVRANRLNLEGKSSGLIREAVRIFDDTKSLFPQAALNVSSMDYSARDEISRMLGVLPYKVDPKEQVPNSRPRYCWTTMNMENLDGLHITEKPGYKEVWVAGEWPAPAQWLTPGWEQAAPGVIYPTFMKAIRRERPPPRPAGIERTDAGTRCRWESEAFRFPPYQYKSQYVVYNPAGEGRLLNADERELLMGYGRSHTMLCMSASEAKGQPTSFEDERCSLVGDSFSIWSFVLFAGAAVAKYTGIFKPDLLFSRMGLPPGAGLHPALSCPLQFGCLFPSFSASRTVKQLNDHLCARVKHTGSDIRITTGQVMNPSALPRQSVQASWWNWTAVFSTRWSQTEHINALEIRAIYLTILWKVMNRQLVNRRMFHLTDSYVALSILSKGRTGSAKLRYIVRKINSLLLVSHSLLHLAHVDSYENPTDAASRA